MVGVAGFEPATSWSQTKRASQLRYTPKLHDCIEGYLLLQYFRDFYFLSPFMDVYFIIGISGMVLILFAFFMNQTNRWKNKDLSYDAVNLLGSLLLLIYALPPLSYPFIVLNGVWALVSLRDVITDLRRKK